MDSSGSNLMSFPTKDGICSVFEDLLLFHWFLSVILHLAYILPKCLMIFIWHSHCKNKSSLWSNLICVSGSYPILGKILWMSYIIFELFQRKASILLVRNWKHVLPSPALRMLLDFWTYPDLVLVFCFCHNKLPQIWWLKKEDKLINLQFCRLEISHGSH